MVVYIYLLIRAKENIMKTPSDMFTGAIFNTKNFGKLIIQKYITAFNVQIKFLNTNTIISVRAGNIRIGAIRDPYKPNIENIGFTGIGKYTKTRHGRYKKIYEVWSGMIKRCYSVNSHKIHPTYKKCTVCKKWHNFQNFAIWFEQNYTSGLHIDKDIIISGNTEYSPLTCKFVSQKENNQKANAKYFTLISPTGKQHRIYNLEKFCRNNNLHSASLRQVRSGKRTHCKGWKMFTFAQSIK